MTSSKDNTLTDPQERGPSTGLILTFFFLTGLTGLAYELVWIRLLILVFGSTQFAVTTVLTVFMTGLALGSLLFGRFIDRPFGKGSTYPHPLKVYGLIEIALGIYCMLSPQVFELLRSTYLITFGGIGGGTPGTVSFEGTQFFLSFLGLIIPTTLMGGTLPILVKYLTKSKGQVGRSTALPYAINTLGAVTGCLATGLGALYILGVRSTIYAAGIIDIVIGIILIVAVKGRASKIEEEPEVPLGIAPLGTAPVEETEAPIEVGVGEKEASRRDLIIIAAFTISGFCSLAYEVLWTRILSLVLGSSVYAFTIMLATFLAGISLGSIAISKGIDKRKNLILLFGLLEGLIGLAGLITVLLYKELPFIFFNLKESFGGDFYLFLFIQFLLTASLMIVPTLAMGAIFPIVGKLHTRKLSKVGSRIGDIYFFNTTGSIFGAFMGGFYLIPVVGIQNSIILVAAINIALAVALLFISEAGRRRGGALSAVLVLTFVTVASMLPPWQRTLMTMGLYTNPVMGLTAEELKERGKGEKLIMYREGINAVVTVREEGDVISYQANGKHEARAEGDKPAEAWSILGHIPLLLHDWKGGADPVGDTLIVGLGSGITLGAMTQYPIGDIDVIELEESVIAAAGFFHKSNNNALEDERVNMHVTDGRSFLFTGEKRYDVIVSAVSDPWITGVSNLFTLEYFRGLEEKLTEGGIVSLWFQNYKITEEELRIGLNTFREVFPHVSIYFHYTDALDLVVIGTREPHSFDLENVEKLMEDTKIKKDLSRIGIKTPYELFDLYIAGSRDVASLGGVTKLNTDENPILEFTLPKHMYQPPSENILLLEKILKNAEEVIPPVKVEEARRVEFLLNTGKVYNRSAFKLDRALKVFEMVLDVDPGNEEAGRYSASIKEEISER